jgi:short-subunit dehydrogenase
MQRTGKTAIVTGASAGLGVHFARLLARDGHDLVLIARRRDKLDEVAAELRATGTHTTVIAADLAGPHAPGHIHDEIARAGAEADFLVNNAGVGTSGAFAELDIERELEMVDINIKAIMHLTRLFLPAMVARGSGRILNIASGAGFLPGPYMATYYASKAFVISFTEALAYELRDTGVTATASCPPPTATEFAAIAGAENSALFKDMADPAEVAGYSYRAMMAGKTIAIPGLKNKLSIQSLRLSPRSMTPALAARLNRRSSAA